MNDQDLAKKMFKKKIWHHTLQITCPDCKGTSFLAGPRDGLSQNIKCADPECGAEFNVCPPHFAERI